jgi:hypothetical protein
VPARACGISGWAMALLALLLLPLLLLGLLGLAAAGSTVKLCGGRSVSVPVLGTYSFQVTAVYQDEKFGFRCVRLTVDSEGASRVLEQSGKIHAPSAIRSFACQLFHARSGSREIAKRVTAGMDCAGWRPARGELFRQPRRASNRGNFTGGAMPY